MNPMLVVITGHRAAAETIKRHWPFFKRSGCDLCGAASENAADMWPEPISLIDLGAETGRGGDSLPRNFLKTLQSFYESETLSKYGSIAIVEYDCVFVAAVPEVWIPNDEQPVKAHLAGGVYPGLLAKNFFHPPWIIAREFIPNIVKWGSQMISEGDFEKGYTDFFIGRMADRFGFQIQYVQGVYSRNTLEDSNEQKQVRKLVEEGRLVMVHGIKTAQQLEAAIP